MYYFCPMHCTSFFRKLLIGAAVGTMFVFSACSPTKNLGDGQYFFTGYKIKSDNKTINKDQLHPYIRQKPNRKFFFLFRLQMGFYQLGEKFDPHPDSLNWLKKIGEAPVVLDTTLVHRSTDQLKYFMNRKGYFHAVSQDTIIFKKKKAKVIYTITSGSPYIIKNIEYVCRDTGISPRIMTDLKNSLLKPGMIYDEDILDAERERLTDVMKSQGYYFFTKQYISYSADSALLSNEMNIKMIVSRLHEDTAAGVDNAESHHQYYLNRIFIRTDYDPKAADIPEYDTVSYKNYYFLVNKKAPALRYRWDVLLRATFISTGDLFNINEVKYTYARLTDLNVFRFVNIRFDEVPRDESQQNYLLDVNILFTPTRNKDLTAELEGTHNAGTMGIAGNVSFRNKNAFKGAELFELRLKGGLEFQKTISDDENQTVGIFNTYEIGPEVSLNLKKLFVIDPLFRHYSRKWNPRTRISVAANYQERPDYNRSIGSFNYSWKFSTTGRWQVSLDLLDINFVDVRLSESFINKLIQINDQGLFYSYSDHLITAGRFNIVYSNQDNSELRNHLYIKYSPEVSGWVLSNILINTSIIEEDANGKRQAFGLNYSEYVKHELDVRRYWSLFANNIVAARANIGLGIPYGNSIVLPFEKSFYGGGSNSLRAWRYRSLGPGSYVNTFNIEQTGDIKIEVNGEIRSPLSKRFGGIGLEGALFVDAGNIWLSNEDSARVGGQFDRDKFLSEFAIGTGLGLRFNFNYFILRIDGAVKLRDPSLPESDRWVYFGQSPQKLAARDINFNFGIGYPF
jgi:outer membrane protein assembly factor BamA